MQANVLPLCGLLSVAELLTDMKVPTQFTKAISVCTVLMTTL